MANGDEFTVDLSNYKDRVGSRVVPGRYRVRVDDAEMDQTQAGDTMINVWLVVADGEFEGATVIDRLLPQHPKALFRIVGFMQAIGLPTPKKRLRLNIGQFIGKMLEVDIEDGDPYNGRVKSEVRGYYRIEKKAGDEPADLEIPDDEAVAAEGEESRNGQAEVPGHPGGMDEFAPVDLEDLDIG